MQSYPQVMTDFLTYLETIRGKSKKTVDEYALDLRMFFRFEKLYKSGISSYEELDSTTISDIDIDFIRDISLSDIYAFLSYLAREKNDKAATRARKISSLRSFFKYLTTKANLLDINPCDNLDAPKIRSALPRYLSLDEAIQLLSAVDGPYQERDFCILVFFLNCGMRLSELAGINLSNITDNTLTVLGKGNKERMIYLNDACLDALQRYLAVRGDLKPKPLYRDALFLSRRGERLSVKMIQYLVKKYLEQAGLGDRHYSTHKLRHTAATLMFRDGGVDLRTLQEILGHAQLSTTQIYTHVSDRQLEDAVAKNPLARVTGKKLLKEDK